MKKNGFTLVELLVVIAIMSILSVITYSQFQTAKKKANDVARKGDLNAMTKALQMHFADYGYFPTSLGGADINGEGWVTDASWCPDKNNCPFQDASGYTYLTILPTEKTRGNVPYCYLVGETNPTNSQPRAYALFANLENREDNDCKTDPDDKSEGIYSCGGQTNAYCYGVTSANAVINPNTDEVEVP